jgi:hypothetical protein
MNNESSWFYIQNGNQQGPLSREKISELIKDGFLDEQTQVWTSSLDEWIPLYRSELRSLLETNPNLVGNVSSSPVRDRKEYKLYDLNILSKITYWALLGTGLVIARLIFIGLIFKSGDINQRYERLNSFENGELYLIYALVPLVSILIFFIWKYRSTSNLFHYHGNQSVTPAGSVYWYFVPVAFFWKPLEAMRNLVNGFNTSLGEKRKGINFTLISWWCCFWGYMLIWILFIWTDPEISETREYLPIYVYVAYTSYTLEIIAYFLLAGLVKQISEDQKNFQNS